MKQKESEKSYTMRLYSTNYYRQMNNLTSFGKESGKLHLFLKLLKNTKCSMQSLLSHETILETKEGACSRVIINDACPIYVLSLMFPSLRNEN